MKGASCFVQFGDVGHVEVCQVESSCFWILLF